MFKRRRRRSSFSRGGRSGGILASPQQRYIVIGAAVAVFIGLFVFFMHQADELAPPTSEMRVELPDAFKQ